MRTEQHLTLRATLRGLLRSRRGGTAAVFTLMLPVLVATMGFGLDVSRYAIARNQLQTAADAAALAAAQDVPGNPTAVAVDMAHANLPSELAGAIVAGDVTVGTYSNAGGFVAGASEDANAVRVTGTRSPQRNNPFASTFALSFLDTVNVAAVAVKPASSNYEPPESTSLDNEAGDYNEIYAYCFDYASEAPPAERRSQMTLISNNMGEQDIVAYSSGVITAAPVANPSWPDCRAAGLSISFRLRNIRHAKSLRNLWQNPGAAPGRPEYNHYTDTVLEDGRENFAGLTSSVIETVVCETAAQCDSRESTFIGRSGRNRTPDVATGACAPGKFMYFGWEDRPPGQSGPSADWTDPAWTDRDYDDIRLLLKCPRGGRLGDAFVRLVK